MDRPLWQILLCMTLLGFAIERVVVASALGTERIGSDGIAFFGLQAALGVVAAVVCWVRREWTLGWAFGLFLAWAVSVALVSLLGGSPAQA
jgi:hypothetical protein